MDIFFVMRFSQVCTKFKVQSVLIYVFLYQCLGKFSLSGKKKEKKLGKVVPDILARGGLVWPTQVGSVLLL